MKIEESDWLLDKRFPSSIKTFSVVSGGMLFYSTALSTETDSLALKALKADNARNSLLQRVLESTR